MATIEERLKDAPLRLVILAACAFARTVEHLLADERSLAAIEIAERFADGRATLRELEAAASAARSAWIEARTARQSWLADRAAMPAWAALATIREGTADAPSATTVAASAAAEVAGQEVNNSLLDCLLAPRVQGSFPSHVKGLASQVYDRRDWPLLMILADALEDLGQEEMAAHCRTKTHAKGCFVLDSILGRS